MRIAVSGSHATGKSSLVSELALRLNHLTAVDEPYYLLEDEGHTFASPPTLDDFEMLLERSITLFAEKRSDDVLFDRSPADYLAYMVAVSTATVPQDCMTKVTAAMASLDLVVFVPIEHPDRVETIEAPRLRRNVDRVLHEMLVDGAWPFDVPVVVVTGMTTERADQVQARLPLARPTTQPNER